VAKGLHHELAPTLAMAKYLVEDAAQHGCVADQTASIRYRNGGNPYYPKRVVGHPIDPVTGRLS
jgi:predicted N-acyltransferase